MREIVRRVPIRSPADIAGLDLWLEADAGVTTDGSGLVTGWLDRSGRGRHASASGAGRPAAASVGGRPAIATGASTFLAIPKALAPLPGTGATAYWIGSTSSALTVIGVWGLWSTVTSGAIWLHAINDATAAQTAAYINETGTNTNRSSKGAGDPSDGLTHVNILRWSGSQVIAGLDGVEATGVACAGAKAPTVDTQDFSIGRYQATLASPAATVYHRALIIYSRYIAAGSAEDVAIRAYLRARWGTP